MHHLQTTSAFVLKAFPHGESNRVYKLLTRDLGLLYAHGQGVRELKSRNRYALQIGTFIEVTLVRGRETWRITGVSRDGDGEHTHTQTAGVSERKLADLAGKFLAVEDKAVDIFDILKNSHKALLDSDDEQYTLVEVITALRLLDKLGYLAHPVTDPLIGVFLKDIDISKDILNKAVANKKVLVGHVNSALAEANQ